MRSISSSDSKRSDPVDLLGMSRYEGKSEEKPLLQPLFPKPSAAKVAPPAVPMLPAAPRPVDPVVTPAKPRLLASDVGFTARIRAKRHKAEADRRAALAKAPISGSS